ncbi:hypothetical protein HMPREF0083_01788 [Aneurinibacillus aneurinilyticus ATCC 12856]|uniref:Uncharacterized protein n=1 Tax=Aneurinibacillus aneurinilyticus ATCC 12856 TaxID=649747 RepID=U1WNJ3_ANEAE|nr:hypothetical protein HMPREF0083_01788 [Aneurinibacillus aneurinilyticus ATCC 12856]
MFCDVSSYSPYLTLVGLFFLLQKLSYIFDALANDKFEKGVND